MLGVFFLIHFIIPIQFSLSPSGFSISNVPGEEVIAAASRGVRVLYNFPWGQEALETLWSRGDAELLHVHNGVRSKLQVSFSLITCFYWLH